MQYKYIFLIFVSLLLSACSANKQNTPNGTTPLHIIYATQYLGLHEQKDQKRLQRFVRVNPVRIEWCAAFVNAVLEANGITGTRSLSARTFLKWGESIDQPQLGDIMVFGRGNNLWQGHVAFYLGTIEKNNKTYYKILGGNQGDMVKISYYPAKHLLGIRTIKNSQLILTESNFTN
jgi:uncharacterized protein (TIGR02594 family)